MTMLATAKSPRPPFAKSARNRVRNFAFSFWILLAGSFPGLPAPAFASPESDRVQFQNFFTRRFPALALVDFTNGVYAINADARQQWQSFEDFPPYESAIEQGQTRFETPFANGRHYADCFEHGGIGIRQHFPRFNPETGQLETLESAINACRIQNGESELAYGKGELMQLSAYMAYTSRGKNIQVVIPDDPRALAAYEAGKRYYYSRRGQLNMSCAGCHVQGSGLRLRAETTSPGLGQTSHFPVFRLKWDELGSLHRRFAGCNTQVRAKPLPLQSETYKQLEYFLTYMSNGLPLNGPAVRK